ncbi:MAG: alpha-hydroxy acid oxidase [Acidimicrobiales bacterium]
MEFGFRALDSDLAAHVAAGAGDGSTTVENRAALDRYKLIPAVARGVGTPELGTNLLGFELNFPVITAPMGPLELIDPGGARAVALAAAECGVATTVALTSSPILEDVVDPDVPAMFQLYWWGGRDWVSEMATRAATAGYRAIVVTVDVPDYGTRWADVRSGFDHHSLMALPNLATAPATRDERLAFQRTLTFADISWLCELSPIPIVVKGILAGVDATRAIEAGASAVYVSNHGGRALAGQIATVDALPEVVAAVDGTIPVVVDGGFRTAEDVAKALCLGADVVALGRGIAFALAAGGSTGVSTYLSLLEADLRTALIVLGASSPADLDATRVRRI